MLESRILRSRCASDAIPWYVPPAQPMKVSRYAPGERFEMHTDAVRGDMRSEPVDVDDWWADKQRAEYGVVGAPISGANRIVTIFVYLNTGKQSDELNTHKFALHGN